MAGWCRSHPSKEREMTLYERLAEYLIGICMAGFVGLTLWSLI
jgi:hypothetical protein